ncbi:hypothetical protein UFOVP972_73 [uncultured Caudovirales phage]|uniref:Uncharacterized protein n=1 Tax=uncultured Caudovirales phage TaxID=2100421 RepID=A0A6J5Q581_9CAUD|nr:hypothetical protein UFOVP972_73 [uncultured Caudovirales phage]
MLKSFSEFIGESSLSANAKNYTSVDQFKLDWKAMGNKIKVIESNPGPDELTNGSGKNGVKVNGSILGIVIEIFTAYGKKGVKITGGNDIAHIGMTHVKNVHELGQAIDLVPPNGGVDSALDALLKKYVTKYPGFTYINEFTNPSSASNGGHYHLQYTGPALAAPVAVQPKSQTAMKPAQNYLSTPAESTRVSTYQKPLPNLKTYKP